MRWLFLLLPLLLGCAATEREPAAKLGSELRERRGGTREGEAPPGTKSVEQVEIETPVVDVTALLATLRAEDRAARVAAAEALGRLKANEAIGPLRNAVLARVHDEDELRRYVKALREIGPPAADALAQILRDDRDELFPQLTELDQPSPNDDLRQEAAFALWSHACYDAASARAAAPALADALGDSSLRASVRLFCLRGLEQARAPATAVEPALAAALRDKRLDPSVRIEASVALAQLATTRGAGLPTLAWALGDTNPRVRIAAARALLALGARARPARDALRRASRDADPLVARTSSRALRASGPSSGE